MNNVVKNLLSICIMGGLFLAIGLPTEIQANGKHPAYVAALKKQQAFLKEWPSERRWKEYYTYQRLSWELGREVLATMHLKKGQAYTGHKFLDHKNVTPVAVEVTAYRPVQAQKYQTKTGVHAKHVKYAASGNSFSNVAGTVANTNSYQDSGAKQSSFAAVSQHYSL